jgi:hypothetical protein
VRHLLRGMITKVIENYEMARQLDIETCQVS